MAEQTSAPRKLIEVYARQQFMRGEEPTPEIIRAAEHHFEVGDRAAVTARVYWDAATAAAEADLEVREQGRWEVAAAEQEALQAEIDALRQRIAELEAEVERSHRALDELPVPSTTTTGTERAPLSYRIREFVVPWRMFHRVRGEADQLYSESRRLRQRIAELEGRLAAADRLAEALNRLGCIQLSSGAVYTCREIKGYPRSSYCFICDALAAYEALDG